MSSTAVKVTPPPGKGLRPIGRAPLSVVPGARVVRQAWFPLAMALTLGLSLIATLMINTALAQGSYERDRLVGESTVLADRQESLTHDLDNLRAPAAVATRALALGMVPARSAAFVRLADGAVLGVAEAASADAPFTVITEPTLKPVKNRTGSSSTQKAVSASSSAAPVTDAPAADAPAED